MDQSKTSLRRLHSRYSRQALGQDDVTIPGCGGGGGGHEWKQPRARVQRVRGRGVITNEKSASFKNAGGDVKNEWGFSFDSI
jgi:hypothetical protein